MIIDKSLGVPIERARSQLFMGLLATSPWIPFVKPKNAGILMIDAVGGAGGGGAGISGAAGGNRGGGGGGGFPGSTRLIIAASFLPDILYVQPGAGGVGGITNGAAGGNGGQSFVSVQPTSTGAINLVQASGDVALPAIGGTGGTAGAPGPGGFGETVANSTRSAFFGFGNTTLLGGSSGNAGGSFVALNGGDLFLPSTGIILSAGAGGGSANATAGQGNGGSVVGAGKIPTTAGGTAPGGKGAEGWQKLFAGWATGGGGGAASDAGTAGAGGAGGPGCGGGGGGGGVTFGAGGNGGPGYVIIAWW